MEAPAPDLDRLEEKLLRLKREYDLYLAGQRRGEPTAFHDEVQREILKMTRYPFHSTAAKFRMRTLAQRFRALETQLRNLLDQRQARKKDEEPAREAGPAALVVDHAALEHPEALSSHLRHMQRALADALAGRQAPAVDTLRQRLLDEARRILTRPGVYGVRFVLVEDDAGPKIRGEVIPQPRGI